MSHAFALSQTLDRAIDREIQISARFCGPPGSGNGGFAVGLLGDFAGREAEVTLKRPIPLDAPLRVISQQDGVAALVQGEHAIAEARATELEVDIPDPATFQHASAARADYPGYRSHPFPHCFVCGTQRSCDDGLCLFTGPIAEGIVASPWVPRSEFASEAGHIRPEIVGAALDCPGAWAFIDRYGMEGPVVLGKMGYRLERPILARRRYVVMGWALGRERRKRFCGTAVFDDKGALCAVAEAVWIVLG